jgi:transglutaminase-like putative cysteine protease
VLVLLASLLTPTGARGFEPQAPELDRWLAAIESDTPPIGNRAALGLLERLERRDGQRRAEFEAASRRALPAKAAERLAQARAAYEAGQGRLLGLLREISGSTGGVDRAAAAREARAILTRLSDASRREPLSAELKVRAPALASGPLPRRSGAAPGPEAAIGPVPPALQALADSLSGPVEAYAWVRNNLRSEFYYGSLKGPLQAFLDKSGNDADSAAVLIALLRARGTPARFVQGTAQVDTARLLAVTGTATPEQAVRVLERAGIPHEPIVGSAGVTAVKLARVWAEAYVPYANYRGLPVDAQGKLWLPLDPGFKDLHAPTGHDVVTELGLDPRALVDEYLAAPRSLTPRGFLRQRVGELLAPLGLTYEQALNDRSLLPEELGILPNALPYKPVGPTDASYDAPLPHAVRVVGEWNGTTLIDATLPLPTALGQRLTLSYVPFDQDDAQTVALYGSLHLTPPYLIDVKPVLKLGGVPIAAGEAAVGMAVKYDLRLELSFPGGREDVHNQVLAGNLMAIGLAGGEASGQEQQNDQAAALLARAAFDYLRRWNQSDAELADLFRVVPVRPTASACFVMSDIEVEYAGGDPLYPISFDWKGVAVDADLRASAPAGVEGRAAEPRFALMSGLEGSILENRLFEDLWNVPSVSTAKALQLAAQQGTSVLTVTSGNLDAVLPGLPFDAAVRAEIRDAALRGFTVRVPEAPVSYLAWTGVGYWILDEETGESAWQLQGGHSGGVTAPARIDWPPGPLAETLIDQGEAAAQSANEVKRILKFVSTDYQEGYVNQALGRPYRVMVDDAEGHRLLLMRLSATREPEDRQHRQGHEPERR